MSKFTAKRDFTNQNTSLYTRPAKRVEKTRNKILENPSQSRVQLSPSDKRDRAYLPIPTLLYPQFHHIKLGPHIRSSQTRQRRATDRKREKKGRRKKKRPHTAALCAMHHLHVF